MPHVRRKQLNRIGRLAIGCVAMIAIAGGPATQVVASTAQVQPTMSRTQNVDWLSSQTASSLNLGFTVLVPGGIPSPFGGEPSVSASGGYYSLYWMNVSADPTFLQITGQVGGSLPAGSPYDLNNQLFVNASVQGNDAIHDVTPIYDQVWWIADGVLYSVASKNLDGTDSLSLANSLVVLQAPSGSEGGNTPSDTPTETAEPTADPAPTAAPVLPTISAQGSATAGDTIAVSIGDAVNVNLSADGGTFADTGDSAVNNVNGGTYNWQAPAVSANTTFTIAVTRPQTGETLTSTKIAVSPASAARSAGNGSSADAKAAPTSVPAVPTQPANDSGSGNGTGSQANGDGAASQTSGDSTVSTSAMTPVPVTSGTKSRSDGTDGPPPVVVGGDGTGGIQVVTIPKSTGTGPRP